MYSKKVMDLFQNPKNVGEIEEADGTGEVGNPHCGDMTKITIKVEDNKIADIKFKTYGCVAAVTTSSMTTMLAKGRALDEAEKISREDIAEALEGLPQVKMHCSNIAVNALREAIKDYKSRHNDNR